MIKHCLFLLNKFTTEANLTVWNAILHMENPVVVESNHRHMSLTLTCGIFLQADVKNIEMVPALHKHKTGKKSPECHSVCVCKHQGMSEGPKEWFLGRDRKFQARLLSISKVLFSPSCPRCPASQQRHSVTQHTKWDVTCAAILFYLYWMGRHWGRNAKQRSPAAWWGLVALQVHGGGCVIFTLTSEGGRETSPLLNNFNFPPQPASPTLPPKAKKNSR